MPDNDYRHTLNLPHHSFPMKANLPNKEPQWMVKWQSDQYYDKLATRQDEHGNPAPLFVLHDGPPYANGRIHFGHAVNKFLKDLINKSHIMRGGGVLPMCQVGIVMAYP